MKHMTVAGLMLLCLAGQASAQVMVGVRTGSVVYGGPQVRFAFQRGPVFFGGSFGRGAVVTRPISIAPVFPQPIIYSPVLVAPSPNITVNNFYGGGLPILGPGYDHDIRGVNLDRVPLEKPPAPPAPAPIPKAPDKPLPGVDVSKPRPSVRPDEPVPEKKAAPKPPKVLEPADESALLIELGLSSFRNAKYGLAAQRFRQAAKIAPKLTRASFLLSQAEFANGNYRDAVAAIHEGMKVDKTWPLTQEPRADLYKGLDAEYSEQIKRLTDAVAANPDNPTLLFLIAHQLWFDGQRKDAVTLFHRTRPLTHDKMFVDAFLAAGAGA